MIICIVNFQVFVGMCRNNNKKKRSTTTTTFKLIDRDARGEIAVQLITSGFPREIRRFFHALTSTFQGLYQNHV